jgi:hypothetical protein
MKNFQIIIATLITSFVFTLNSCKKKDESPPALANGTLLFHLHTVVDTAEVPDYVSINTMTSGRKIKVTKAQLYISGIQLMKMDGSTYNVPGVIILKKQEKEVCPIGSVPSGNYQSVKFNVGLSTAVNSLTPAAADSTLNQPAMWFDAAAQPSGFVFVNFQGTIDTTTAANGSISQMQPFCYEIGTNANLKNVSMPVQNFMVSPNQVQYVHMIIDYNKLFNGIQLNINSNLTMNTTTANAGILGASIANNIPLMFRYEM